MTAFTDQEFVSGTTITSTWLNGVNDHIKTIESSTGAGLVGYLPSGTGAVSRTVQDKMRETISVKDFGAVGDGVTDDTSSIQAADAAASGKQLVFPAGTYKVASSVTFASRVVMMAGAQISVASSSVYLKFGIGFDAPLSYCLNTDGPTQFIGIKAIYPQWFGNCGLTSQDSSAALVRAFRACRASANSSTATPGSDYGCRTVHFISGVYRCNSVPVYCGTVIQGEAHGSLFNSLIQQIDITLPALIFVPKNYALDGTVINNGVGQNFINDMGFRSEAINDSATNAEICQFYSPAQATALLAIAGDSSGTTGHVDTIFRHTWWKDSAGHCIGCNEGQFGVHVEDSIFDVVRGGVRHSGTAWGQVRCSNTWFYVAVRNALENVSTEATHGVSWYLDDCEFKAGNCQNATAAYRNSLYYDPNSRVTGTEIVVNGARFKNSTVSATRFGGRMHLAKVETLVMNGVFMQDPDSASSGKAAYVDATVVLINGLHVKSDTLASYASARLIQIGSAPTLLRISDASFWNTNGSAIPNAITADVTISTGEFYIRTVGSFTAPLDTANIYQQQLRNTIKGLTVEKPGTAAPTSGTWSVGDRVINSVPTVGQPKAWVCTAAGTPGTWASEGNL